MVPSLRPQQDKYQNIYSQLGAENSSKNSIFSISTLMVSMFVSPPPKCMCSKHNSSDFPGGSVVKNPSYSTGNAGSILGQGTKIPHALEHLSPCAKLQSPCITSKKIPHDTTKIQNTVTKTRHSQINKFFLKIPNVMEL